MPNRQKVLDFNTALEHLSDVQANPSPTTLGALTGAKKNDLAPFAQTWTALPVSRRRRVSQMLVDVAEENFQFDFNLLFRYMLDDEDAQVRVHAIDGLWEDEDNALVKPLIGFLRSDPDPSVRAAAADALGRFVLLAEYERLTQPALAGLIHEALLATIKSGTEDPIVRARAVEALSYWSDDRMRAIIAAAYEDPDAEMRASAVSAMGRSADSYWRATAAGELESPIARMRFEAARAVGELEDRSAVPRLIELLEDSDREVQGAAITALGQIGGRPARQALRSAADSDDEVVSELADAALQELEFTSGSDYLLFDLAGEPEDILGEDGDEDDDAEEDEDVDDDEELDEDADEDFPDGDEESELPDLDGDF
jgi:HEAT repeat protein